MSHRGNALIVVPLDGRRAGRNAPFFRDSFARRKNGPQTHAVRVVTRRPEQPRGHSADGGDPGAPRSDRRAVSVVQPRGAEPNPRLLVFPEIGAI